MNLEKLVVEFLLESTIPGIRKLIYDRNTEKMFRLVVDKAHRDTMLGDRYKNSEYSVNYCNYNEYYRDFIVRFLQNNHVTISGRELIDKTLNENKHNINIDLIQKLVNMTIKYLYVIEACGYAGKDCFSFSISKNDIDCPLDRNIIMILSGEVDKTYSHIAWTKLIDEEKYEEIQNKIAALDYVKMNPEYDFYHWGLTDLADSEKKGSK